MKLEIKDLWVAALRSGEYEQTQAVLKRGDEGMCCLGVLCDIYHKTENKGEWVGGYFYDTEGGESDTELTDSVGVWASIKENDAWVPITTRTPDIDRGFTSERTYLAALNDEGLSFSQIADVIEHFYAEL